MARVDLRNVGKVYPGGVQAVRDASLTVEDKEFVVLVGPSGCGKSTALRMIAGLESVTTGEILIGEECVNDAAPKDRDIAMVFQNYALYPHMTVYKNMAFGLTLRRFPRKEIKARVAEAAEILGIEHLLNRKPKALSGGERQRVAVGRAIVRQPKVFLFDEPLSNLDAKLRVQMRAEISKLHRRLRATMIYVTHDQVEAMTMGDRIVVMREGAIQQIAPPMELYNRPANTFVAGFIGSPPMNLVDGVLEAANGSLRFHRAESRLSLTVAPEHQAALERYTGRPVSLGVRPEHIMGPAEAAANGDSFSARVDVVEPMGAEINLYLDTGGAMLTARVGPGARCAPGEERTFNVAMDRVHYFDAAAGDAIPTR